MTTYKGVGTRQYHNLCRTSGMEFIWEIISKFLGIFKDPMSILLKACWKTCRYSKSVHDTVKWLWYFNSGCKFQGYVMITSKAPPRASVLQSNWIFSVLHIHYGKVASLTLCTLYVSPPTWMSCTFLYLIPCFNILSLWQYIKNIYRVKIELL